ncbi:MAG: phospho-N-acetylmuramoyl-pentapeptide-transferase [OCS116 cluster bacterium]|nr:phospho-N-acetylmuramoyl-pentapeptide-transferase [OCS116 cluster bacterium]
MIHYLVSEFSEYFSFLNAFSYITSRVGAAVLTSMLLVFLFGPGLIKQLKIKQGEGQPIREDGPQSHLLTKKGTPTMGGLMILMGIIVSTLLWADLSNMYVWYVLLVTLGFGAIGYYDDYLKIKKRSADTNFSGKMRLLLESIVAFAGVAGIMSLQREGFDTSLAFPLFKDLLVNLGWFFPVFAVFTIVGFGNAVNLTDGLDGLAIVPVMIAASTFALLSYIVGNAVFSGYLQVHAVPGTGELAVLLGALVGAGIGFLWFNAPPAMIFMGDTGSLALGGTLGVVAVAIKHEIVLAIVGGLFVLETVSVIVQVASFKLTGKRVFRMAPLHHHYEQKGWAESTIVIRFWIIAVILAMVGLATLKLR